MKEILIKTVMIPLPDYVTIKETDTVYDMFQVLEKANQMAATPIGMLLSLTTMASSRETLP